MDTITLKQAVSIVLEGFTLPDAARKILETAYWADVALAQQAEQGWQPIETAPHNSNHVLALSASGSIRIETGYWLVNLLHASKVDGDNCNYTHWMPLPSAPKGGV